MHPALGGWRIGDIESSRPSTSTPARSAGPLEEAIFAPPNNTKESFARLHPTGVIVQMGQILDGVAAHMADYPA